MPRHPRFFVPQATYQVDCRVARGEYIFDDGVEAGGFVESVGAVRDRDDWRILAWVLMGNHYHLVVKTGRAPLWRSMLRLLADIADLSSVLKRPELVRARIEYTTLAVVRYGLRSTEAAA